eukprot:9565477-Ditylum_brightwellii.AAC.1
MGICLPFSSSSSHPSGSEGSKDILVYIIVMRFVLPFPWKRECFQSSSSTAIIFYPAMPGELTLPMGSPKYHNCA